MSIAFDRFIRKPWRGRWNQSNYARISLFVVTLMVVIANGAPLYAIPPGYVQQSTVFDPAFRGAAALVYALDGTLFVAEAAAFNTNTTTIHVIQANGTFGSPITLIGDGPDNLFIQGMAMTAAGHLLITDNATGAGTIYSVDPNSGTKTTLSFVSLLTIDDIAVRSTGEIFVSNAAGSGAGGVLLVDPINSAVNQITGGLDFASGLDFDSDGDLVIQQSTNSFEGQVFRVEIDDTGSQLSFGLPDTIAAGLTAGFDLVVDDEDDIFVTGAGGLFELDRDLQGNFTGTATLFESHGFSTEIDFLAGVHSFAPDNGPDAGVLSYIAEFNDATLTNVAPVPEPVSLTLLTFGFVLIVISRMGARTRVLCGVARYTNPTRKRGRVRVHNQRCVRH